jgi:hypothetical protein
MDIHLGNRVSLGNSDQVRQAIELGELRFQMGFEIHFFVQEIVA